MIIDDKIPNLILIYISYVSNGMLKYVQESNDTVRIVCGQCKSTNDSISIVF